MKYLESKSSIQCTLSSHNLLSILQMYIHTPVFILCDNNAYFTSNIDLQNHFMSVYVDQLFWRILILQYAQYSFFPIPYITQFISICIIWIYTHSVCAYKSIFAAYVNILVDKIASWKYICIIAEPKHINIFIFTYFMVSGKCFRKFASTFIFLLLSLL